VSVFRISISSVPRKNSSWLLSWRFFSFTPKLLRGKYTQWERRSQGEGVVEEKIIIVLMNSQPTKCAES
jgi:hypothetical protein